MSLPHSAIWPGLSAFRITAVSWVLVFLAVPSQAADAVPLTAHEIAGMKIFEEGVSASGGEITANVGTSSFDLPARAVPCANCHGSDGLGRREGGLVPSNVQWSELTKPYGHVHASGRKHGPFDAGSLARSIASGRDPAGNQLDPSMPRYRMSDQDMKDLLAYIRKLEFQLPPGISADRLRIGTVLPLSGRFGEVGAAVRSVIEGTLESVNKKGGLYGRKLELVVVDYGDGPERAYANAWDLVRSRKVFLLLAPFSAGWEEDLARIAREERVPVVAPITIYPEDPRASNTYVFHLLSGVAELAEVLAVYAGDTLKLKDQAAVLLHADSKSGRDIADAFATRLAERGWRSVSKSVFPADADAAAQAAKRMMENGTASVFILSAGFDVVQLGGLAQMLGWNPHLLLPGPLAPRNIVDLPATFTDRVYLAYSTVPGDRAPQALLDYAALNQSGQMVRTHPTIQVPAYAATLATVDVLKRAGRDLNRSKFVASFESLNAFDTGMVPPLTYNADRRIGALGGHIVGLDLKRRDFVTQGKFMRLE